MLYAADMSLHVHLISGQAALPFVHIHGWCCDHRAMLPVAEAFPEATHHLVDLPGHGQSTGPADLSIRTQAAAVLAAVPPACLVVGHSMGGQIALEMAATAPQRIAGAILLDPAHIIATDKVRARGEALKRQLAEHDPAEIVRAFARAQLVGPVDEARFGPLVERMASTPADTARRAWDAIMEYDGAEALARLSVPTLVIAIDKPVNRLPDLARASKSITTAQVAASGHMLQFEAMEQISAMIRRWMTVERIALGTSGGAV